MSARAIAHIGRIIILPVYSSIALNKTWTLTALLQ